VTCQALFISAPASGQGKTSVTAGLARLYRARGKKVRLFKTGPDFLDPMILTRASGSPVQQLDLWMGGEAQCRSLLHSASMEADLILVEGVMGLFDGQPCSADLAQLFQIPVLAVIDASAMAETFGAIATGLRLFRSELPFAGVLANRVASPGHAAMLADSVKGRVPFLGSLYRDEAMALPSRHLGLVQAGELGDLDSRLERIASGLAAAIGDFEPPMVVFPQGDSLSALSPSLKGCRIGIARDDAFAFLYPANIDILVGLGAELCFFSPLADHALPAVDALYLPGGYPELHLRALEENQPMRAAIQAHCADNKPLLAECGGMLYLLGQLSDADGETGQMAAILPGTAVLGKRLANLGLQSVDLPEGSLRGHTFHHAKAEIPLSPIAETKAARHHGKGEMVYRQNRVTASFFHFYFPSNPDAVAGLFQP
jgi:cobyrinic acid a,c-diamide synthase